MIMKRTFLIFFSFFIIGLAVIGIFLYLENKESKDLIKRTQYSERGNVMEELHKHGEGVQRKSHLRAIITTYKKMLIRAPESRDLKKKLSEAYYELGKIDYESGYFVDANSYLEIALEYDPNNSRARSLLAELD